MTAYVYSGAGSSPTNVKILRQIFSEALHPFGMDVEFIGHDDLNRHGARWQRNGDLLIIGGGQFTAMKESLTPYGREALLDFTARKTYLGICKGGYAGAKHIEFIGKVEEKTSPGFGFFNGVAKGSLPVTPELFTGNNDSATILRLYHERHRLYFPALYWGGPSFSLPPLPQEGLELLTTFEQQDGTKHAMGIKVKVGTEGQAVLVGYHSEAFRHFLIDWLTKFSAGETQDTRLKNEVGHYHGWQYYFGFAALLDDLTLVKNHSFVDQILKNAPVPA